MCWGEQIWTVLQWWPPDVTNRGSLWGPIQRGTGDQGGSPYNELQCIMGNDPMGLPCGQNNWLLETDMTENITFPQLRWRVVIMFLIDWRVMVCSSRWNGNEDKKQRNSILTIGQRLNILSKCARPKLCWFLSTVMERDCTEEHINGLCENDVEHWRKYSQPYIPCFLIKGDLLLESKWLAYYCPSTFIYWHMSCIKSRIAPSLTKYYVSLLSVTRNTGRNTFIKRKKIL